MANSYRSLLSVVLGDSESEVFEPLTTNTLDLRLETVDWELWQDKFLDLRLGDYQLQLAHFPELDNVVYSGDDELFSCLAGDTAFFYEMERLDCSSVSVDAFGKPIFNQELLSIQGESLL